MLLRAKLIIKNTHKLNINSNKGEKAYNTWLQVQDQEKGKEYVGIRCKRNS